MARQSKTDNVTKICDCAKWKDCAHPWYVSYREGKEVVDGKVRERGLRRRLAPLVGREPRDFAEAKVEARRAIVAWKDGRDARDLLPTDDPTLAELLAEYDRERPRRDRWQIGRIGKTPMDGHRPFGEWRLSSITTETIKQFRRQRPLVAGNRDLNLLRAAFNWAVLGGKLPRSPFRIGDVPAVKLAREEARTRRLHPGEDEQLMHHARGTLRDVLIAALETGCRKGELLSLQWHQVRFDPRAEIFLPATKTKAKRDRRVPISSILRPVLEGRRLDPAGALLPPDAYVFGDEVGRQRQSIKRSWERVLLLAHDHQPHYVKKANGDKKPIKTAALTAESRCHLRTIDLHFHDLRREAGSRWMDAGIPLATIQRWLGHANVSQTSTYLGASLGGDESDMRAYEARIGRLPNVAVSDDPNGSQPTSTALVLSEKTEKNAVVH